MYVYIFGLSPLCADVSLSLSSGLYSVLEADKFVEVCVRLEGETEVPVSADLFITEGTANGAS